jgi:hypothetical protein
MTNKQYEYTQVRSNDYGGKNFIVMLNEAGQQGFRLVAGGYITITRNTQWAIMEREITDN